MRQVVPDPDRQRASVPVILAVTLGSCLVLIVILNAVISWRCVDVLGQYLSQPEVGTIEDVPVLCDTTTEINTVLDIGLALAGGLVGWLAGSEQYRFVKRWRRLEELEKKQEESTDDSSG